MVARQFIAWYPCKKGNRPVGHGMIGSDRRATIRTTNEPWVRIRPSLRDGFCFFCNPGNKLPGYDHPVPRDKTMTVTGRAGARPYRLLNPN
jgi:hypothetical protein